MVDDVNVKGEKLELCCQDPVTGFYRNGFCMTGPRDHGTHVACAQVTQEFLEFSKSRGNDLITPRPEYNFPGLKPGDKWCLCAMRWAEALDAGVAPPLDLSATQQKMLEHVDLDTLEKYALVAEQKTPDKDLQQSQAGAYQFEFISLNSDPMPLSKYEGKVILIVNTASQCGFTKQYEALQNLYEAYKDMGLVVIGVPCNQFGRQEPGSSDDIRSFVKEQYGVTFPMTSKVNVKGPDAHPFFQWAKDQNKGGFLQSSPKWNFHKYLIDRNGRLQGSYGSHVSPESSKIRDKIVELLQEE